MATAKEWATRRGSEDMEDSRLHAKSGAELGLGTKGEEHDGCEGHAKEIACI